MLEIVRYLGRERIASYKEIADVLDLKERAVRYDIDCINRELSLKEQPLIEKHTKGILFVPDDLDFSLIMDDDFIFSPEERVNYIRILILFDTGHLNIQSLSKRLQVSRRLIQNDIAVVQNELKKYDLVLRYVNGFRLEGESELAYKIRSEELKQYVKVFYKKTKYNAYERNMETAIHNIFEPVNMEKILLWITEVMEKMCWVFSDETYQWYVSNILTFTWYLKNRIPIPLDIQETKGEIDWSIGQYEEYVGRKLTKKEKLILSGFVRYTSRYVNLDVNLDLISIEDLVMQLVANMEHALDYDFLGDGILRKGLLNHIGPMMERVKGGVQLNEDVESLIPAENYDVYQEMKLVIQNDDRLRLLKENEIVYLALYFLASIQRTKQNQYMNILLVCGSGYGTTALVKDSLLNRYQVHVRKSIPEYKVMEYDDWDHIDVVVSTASVELPVPKKMAVVHVVFDDEDYRKLDALGLQQKKLLTNYIAIKKKLNFLSESDLEKVMDVIREELGYKEVRVPSRYYVLSDLLQKDDICFIKRIESWKTAVEYCTNILEQHGYVTRHYKESIIQCMEIQGFYAIADGEFALLHGSENPGVLMSGMSLLVTEEPVQFGDKKVNIIFCLASCDKKEHIPAVIRLMRMVKMTDFIAGLKLCRNRDEAVQLIRECEQEVEGCYQS